MSRPTEGDSTEEPANPGIAPGDPNPSGEIVVSEDSVAEEAALETESSRTQTQSSLSTVVEPTGRGSDGAPPLEEEEARVDAQPVTEPTSSESSVAPPSREEEARADAQPVVTEEAGPVATGPAPSAETETDVQNADLSEVSVTTVNAGNLGAEPEASPAPVISGAAAMGRTRYVLVTNANGTPVPASHGAIDTHTFERESVDAALGRTRREPHGFSAESRFSFYRREQRRVQRRQFEKPLGFLNVDPAPLTEKFIYQQAPGQRHRSRRAAASHYGIPIAGYVVREGTVLPTDDAGLPIVEELDDASAADPALGLSSDCVLALPNEHGLWPVGILNSHEVAWVALPRLDADNIEFTHRQVNFFGRPISAPSQTPCVAEVRVQSRCDNHVLAFPGQVMYGLSKGLVSKHDIVAFRDFCVIYNGIRLDRSVYEGAFPCLEGDPGRSSLPGELAYGNYERVYHGVGFDSCSGLAYNPSARTFFEGGRGDSDLLEVVDRGIAVAQALVGDNAQRVPGYTAEPLASDVFDTLADQPEVAPISEHAENVFSFGGSEVVVPGTMAVQLVDARVVETYSADPKQAPLTTNLVHPYSHAAQTVYNRIVAASGEAGTWSRVSLPTRTVARISYRRDLGGRVHHPGDQAAGGFIRNALLSPVTPEAWFFNPSGPSVMLGLDRARDALVRAVYQHGSSASSGVSFGVVSVDPNGERQNEQSFVGFDGQGVVASSYEEKEVAPILPDSLKSELVNASEEKIREIAADILSLRLGSIPSPSASARPEPRAIDAVSVLREPAPPDPLVESEDAAGNSPLADVLRTPINAALSDDQVACLSQYTEIEPGLLRTLGSRVIQNSTAPTNRAPIRPSSQTWEVHAVLTNAGRKATTARTLGALVGLRVPTRGDRTSNRSAGTFLRDANRHLRHAEPKRARAALLGYMRAEGHMLLGSDTLWQESQLTWEVADLDVAPVNRSGEQTWGDVMYDAFDTSMHYVRRSSREALQVVPRSIARVEISDPSQGRNRPGGGYAQQQQRAGSQRAGRVRTPRSSYRDAATSGNASSTGVGAGTSSSGVRAVQPGPSGATTAQSLSGASQLLRRAFSQRTSDSAEEIISAVRLVAREGSGQARALAEKCVATLDERAAIPAELSGLSGSLAAVITARASDSNPF